MTDMTAASRAGPPPEMTEDEVRIYFTQRLDMIFPLDRRMKLEQFLTHWAREGFDDVSPNFELRIVKAMVSMLEQLDPLHITSVLGELLAQLNARCQHPESVRLLEAFAHAVMHPQPPHHASFGHHPETGPSRLGGPYEATC